MIVRLISQDFFWRRMQSLAGLWLVLFIIEHLITNSQTAFFFGNDGKGFIGAVNWIHSLPYLPAIEVIFLAFPFAVHGLIGLKIAWEAKYNSLPSSGTRPALFQYPRNHGFTWQRITAYVLAVGVILHVAQMRFLDYPSEAGIGAKDFYIVRVADDAGLKTLAERLDFQIFTKKSIEDLSEKISKETFSVREGAHNFLQTLQSKPLREKEVAIAAPNFGTASLLVVRDTFKNPLMMTLYTLFVLAAGYHAFYGLWTAFITWGVNITPIAQRKFFRIANTFMFFVTFLGLASVFLTYLNLKR